MSIRKKYTKQHTQQSLDVLLTNAQQQIFVMWEEQGGTHSELVVRVRGG